MGDKDGARELLNEVMKDGDAAQKGTRRSRCSPSWARRPSRIALGLEYDGSRFLGWQTQPGGGTVQDALEPALAAIAGERRSSVPAPAAPTAACTRACRSCTSTPTRSARRRRGCAA